MIYVILYCILTAVQSVYLSEIFQERSVFLSLFFNFFICMITAWLVFSIKNRSLNFFRNLGIKDFLILNILTLINWASFYFSLKYIEPAVEAAVSTATPTIATVVILKIMRDNNLIKSTDKYSIFGIVLGGIFLCVSSISGFSGVSNRSTFDLITGLALAVICGIGCAYYTIYSKKLSQKLISVIEILSIRFILLLAVSTFIISYNNEWIVFKEKMLISYTSVAIMGTVMPIFLLQYGMSILEPLKVNILITSSPLFFFLAQIFSHTIKFSWFTLIGIIIITASLLFSLPFLNLSKKGRKREKFKLKKLYEKIDVLIE